MFSLVRPLSKTIHVFTRMFLQMENDPDQNRKPRDLNILPVKLISELYNSYTREKRNVVVRPMPDEKC